MDKSKAIFSPIHIGKSKLKNRIVALPVYTGYAHADGRAGSLLIDHYSKLAGSGAAMVVVANAAISPDGILTRHNLRVDEDGYIPGLKRLSSAIKKGGALACLQLNHGGRFARADQPLLPSALAGSNLAFNLASLRDFMDFFPLEQRIGWTRYLLKQAARWRRAMSAVDIGRVINDFGRAASRAFRAGFDMIELHGANGYLLCQFLSSFTNRIDMNDPSALQDRAAVPIAVIREIRRQVPENFPVGFRLILREWVPDGVQFEEALAFARMLEQEGVAYVSASVGSYNSIFSSEAMKTMDRIAYLREDMKRLTRETRIPAIISGRISTPGVANEILMDGAADLIGLGRPLRTDIDWIKKAAGKKKKIKTCINCNQCIKRVVMDQAFTCALWPARDQRRVELEHRLLRQNHNALWLVSNKKDLDLYMSALPGVLPDSRKIESTLQPTILFMRGDGKAGLSGSVRGSFVRWCKDLLNERGFPDIDLREKNMVVKDSFSRRIHARIEKEDHGVVLVGRNRLQPWRERLMHQERGKVVIMIGSNKHDSKVLVPVDLSDITLLVLTVLRQVYLGREGVHVHFIHVSKDPDDAVKKRWREQLNIAGCQEYHDLNLVYSHGDVADRILEILRREPFGTLVMGKRGLSGIKRWMLGSVSARVMKGLKDQTLWLID